MTTALCMNELRGCQKYSMGPNFIYFGAQKYGYRPIPSEIDTAELELLRDALVQMGNDVHLLDKWYRKDANKVSGLGTDRFYFSKFQNRPYKFSWMGFGLGLGLSLC